VSCVVGASLIECCGPLRRPTLTPAQAAELERLFKVLADRHRVQILNLLAGADDAVCVCELEPALGLAQPTVSYHLKLLVEAGLLERERRGRFAFYRLVPGALDRLGELVRGTGAERRAA
jgi:ArsR family transcriptional regulator, arsenate/arsenite/antimonite-responsive transcriptional repressor